MDLICFFIAHLFISGVVSTTFSVTNKCNYTIWPGFLANEDDPPASISSFSLQKGQSKTISPPVSWGYPFWGHTYCTEESTGNFSCITGDCGSGKLECSGNGTATSAILPEFKLVGSGCVADSNVAYFSELKVNSSGGEIDACKCVCKAFGSPHYCASVNYQIIFCAAKTTTPRRRLSSESTKTSTTVSVNATANGPDSTSESSATSPTSSVKASAKGSNSSSSATVITTNETVKTLSPMTVPPSPSPDEKTPSPMPFPPSPSPEEKTPSPMPLPPTPLPDEKTPSRLPKTRPTSRRRLAPIIAGVIGGALLIIFLIVTLILRARWWEEYEKNEDLEADHDIRQVPGTPVRFSYEDLRVATHDFSDTLGKGGSGSVFKGVLPDGTHVAVKKLDKLGQDMSSFLLEVEAIGSINHFNLVRLIGFCAEKSSGLLVFEYMNKGSLDKWIFKNDQGSCLDWQTRNKVALGIAKGLAYLHEDCQKKIIHFDIKPLNILLDANFNAKICDFGLSELVDRDTSQVQTRTRGTCGYIAPECWKTPPGRITVKVDVYSFGIVLLEIVCARRNFDHTQPESENHLLRMLQKKAEQDRLIDIVENLDDQSMQGDREEIIRMIKIAAWCLQDDPERRPFMSAVVKVLEGVMEVESNLVYKFHHALISPAVNRHASPQPQPSVLSCPR
ncbi:PR5-like receptor kinase [Populus alba]|uniref:non-specific serine/threonine protein kinase n=1 Tax=Populus alba x Populus x berolinensis TaxID=444605 RepID=A0AAD6M404_9ROSI|nr:probable LRR receptor-like serine/threonine-protein kinase At5g65240 [Populus alba]KAJ6978523.1 LRR receptor-like serine/threonine-protein kinase [Populus alba x Populus x berolinensis]